MATRASGLTGKASALLANLPVRTKLIAVLALPVVVILLIVGAQISSGRTVAASMSRLDDITRVSTAGLGLVHELQTERDFAVGTVAGQSGTAETQLRTARDKVDQTLGGFRAEAATLDRQLYRPRSSNSSATPSAACATTSPSPGRPCSTGGSTRPRRPTPTGS
jgi:hypothetical protein